MIDQLNAISEQWFQWQWSMLWQSTLLIVLVAVVDRAIRKWAWPQLRYALWLLVLVKLVLPPTLWSPVSVTSPIPTWADKVRISPVMTEPEPRATEPVRSVFYAPEAGDLHAEPALAGVAPVSDTSDTAKTPPSWKAYAMVTWLLVAMALAIGLAIRLRRLRQVHMMDHLHRVPDWFYATLEKAAKEIGCTRLPKVVLSRHVLCPAVFGLFRPVLLVPAEQMEHMSPTHAHHILLHELAHIKRLDLWNHGLHMFLLIAYWFNPLLWFMRKHMQNLRELCCDATVARTLKAHTPAYRETLLETAKSLLAQPVDPGLGLLGLFENSTWLVTRLQWLEKETWRFQRLRVATVSLSVVTMLCCVLPMATAAKLTRDHVQTVTKAINDRAEVNGAVQVQLLGICGYPCEGKAWWRPDGEVLDASRIADPGWRTPMNATNDQQSVILAFQIGDEDLSDVGIAWKPPKDSQRSTYIPTYANRESRLLTKTQYLTANFPKDKKVASLTLGIAVSDWQRVTAWDGRSDGYTNDSLTDRDVHLHKAQSQSGRVHIVISHLMGSDYDCRIVAVDSDGTKHRSVSKSNTGNEMRQCKATFDLALDNIKHFEFQARSYEWIEFQDIALVPHEREPETRPDVQQADVTLPQDSVLTLGEPQYEWWLAKPAKQLTVRAGEPFEINWRVSQTLYDKLDILAVGVYAEGNDISDVHSFEWLAGEVPATARKTAYGQEWPSVLLGSSHEEAKVLAPGLYRIVVCGFSTGQRMDWRYIIKKQLMCVAMAGLTVESAIVDTVSENRPTDKMSRIRRTLNNRLKTDQQPSFKSDLALMSKIWLFSEEVIPGDTLCEYYTVKPGDSLDRIGTTHKVPYQCLMKINGLRRASSLQVGQALKVINGPFHAKVWRSKCKMDLYLQDMYVKTYDIGLGKPGRDIPTGQWMVASRLRRPPWTDPQTGRLYRADDPDYPLGEGYIALKGIWGNAVSRQGFGMHGTQDKGVIGQHTTTGTIAMLNPDFLEAFGFLKEGASFIEVRD